MMIIFHNKNYGLLWLSGVISALGDYTVLVVMPFFIYKITGSTLATGTMFIVATLPSILLGSVSGVIADKFDRKNIMILSDVVRSIFLILLLFVKSSSDIWLIYTAACLDSIIAQFFFSAKSVFLLQIINKEDFISINSIDTTTMNIISLVGPVVSGGVMTFWGIKGVVSINILSFIISGLLIYFVKEENKININDIKNKISFQDQLIIGINFVKESKIIKTMLCISLLVMLAQGIINASMVIFVNKILKKDSIHWGWMVTAQSIGSILGSILVGRIKKFISPTRLITIGLFCMSIVFLSVIHLKVFNAILLALSLMGIVVMCYFIGMQTTLQAEVEAAYRGRVFGFFKSMRSLILLLGLTISSILGKYINILFLLDIVSIIYLIAGIISLLFMRKVKTESKQEIFI